MKKHLALLIALSLLLFNGLFGCASDMVVRREVTESPILEAAMSTDENKIKMVATEAYFDGQRLFVKYILGSLVCYAVGQWEDPEDLIVASRLKTDVTLGGLVLPLEEHSTKSWKIFPHEVDPLFILEQDAWDELMGKVLEKILPDDPYKGVLLDVFSRQYFLYFDENHDLRITGLASKPGRVGIERVWTFSQLVDLSLPLLEDYLLKKGIEDHQVVINTGDSGLYTYPFIYADIENQFVLFAQVNPTSSVERVLATKRDVQLAGHVVGSHVAIIVRPVTAIARLVYLLVDLGWDLIESGGDLIEATVGQMFITDKNKDPPPLSDSAGMDLEAFEKRLDEITNSRTSWGSMKYLIDGEEFFPRLIDVISKAEKSVHIRSYIFDNDDYAITIADLLRDLSREVEVKVLIDGFGTILATKAHPSTLPLEHDPPTSVKGYLTNGSEVKVRKQTNPWLSVDHSKVTVVDGEIAFVGGMNIGREYRYERHDIMIEHTGPVVNYLQQEFDRTWAHAGVLGDLALFTTALETRRNDKPADEGYPVRVLFTKAAEPEIYLTQLEAIRRSQSYIYLENMYFTQDRIIEELIKARHRGVDVRVIIPLEGYMGPFDRANIVAANELMENGIRVFVYPGMLHAKAAVYDGWVCLGSANFDKASFKRNREINIATSHPEAVEELIARLFEPDFNVSHELTEPVEENWTDRIAEILTDQL